MKSVQFDIDIGVEIAVFIGTPSPVPCHVSVGVKKAVVNVKNGDQQCFKWAVLSALFPVGKDANRSSKYTALEGELDWSGLSFPCRPTGICNSCNEPASYTLSGPVCLSGSGPKCIATS